MKRLDAANDNDMAQIVRTRQVWQPRLGRDLSRRGRPADRATNVTGFFAVLAEWSRAEKLAAANDAGAPASRTTARCAMTAETIAKALGGRKRGAAWMARCPAHDDREPSLSISLAPRRQGARALPCRLRSARRDRRASGARRMGNDRRGHWAASPASTKTAFTDRTRRRRPEAH